MDGRGVEDIKALAQQRETEVLAALGLNVSPGRSGYIVINNPRRTDARPSLGIYGGARELGFYDFATGEGGDVFCLVAYFRGWWHLPSHGFVEAMRWLSDLLGIERMTVEERRRAQHLARELAAGRFADRELARESGRGAAFAMWLHAQAAIIGTPVDRYLLNARGIDLRALPVGPRGGSRLPDVLRYKSDAKHIDNAGHATTWPCMIAACVDFAHPVGRIMAVHRTWLNRDGTDKAPVEPARKCWPEVRGLVIPLWRGDTRMPIKEANESGVRETLVLTEGIEDGLTAALAMPERRVWAMISLSNMANVAAALPECIDSVIIHRQNDWEKLQAVEQFERGKQAIEATGRPVAEVLAFGGKDLNDTLRGAA